MRLSSRVVWNEGMHLAQHHLQAQSRYIEDTITFALNHLFFASYGLLGCELDADALRNGTVSLVHARGVMPDGLSFHCPDSDSPPPARPITEQFSPTHDSHVLHLAIPPYRRGQPNCAFHADEQTNARFSAETSEVLDDLTGQDENTVTVGRKNLRLLLDNELADDLVTIPIARIRRDGAGHFIYDPEYIPPSLQVGASSRLMSMTQGLIEMLDAKSNSLLQERRSSRKALADYAAAEVANFWLSHAIHSSLSPLRHHLDTRTSHPEQLFADLSRLAGALCTFSLDADPATLPRYDHEHLDESFGALERHIRTHLGVIIPTNCVTIPVKRRAEYLYDGKVEDKRCFHKARWFLGIQSSASDATVIARVPELIKVCSAEHIVRLVKEAHAGLDIAYVPSPPSALSPRIGSKYFSLDFSGPCAQLMEKVSSVGVYVPAAIPDPDIELLVVLDASS